MFVSTWTNAVSKFLKIPLLNSTENSATSTVAAIPPKMITTGVNEIPEACHERIWKICNLDLISEDEDLVESQSIQFKIKEVNNTRYDWQCNLTKQHIREGNFRIALSSQLSLVKGSVGPIVKATLKCEVKTKSGRTKAFKTDLNLNDTSQPWVICSDNDLNNVVLPDGTTIINLKLKIKRHCNWGELVEDQHEEKREDFSALFQTNLCANVRTLLFDEESSDLIIVTSDGKELVSHKFILKLQNPVFATMLRPDFKEARTGIVNVPDVSGKTMEIILRYLYTGDLLSSWSDADTIVEFTYAAGKYQLTEVLEMLDEKLLSDSSKDYSSCCVSLLSLTNKLSLKKAEARILKQVSKTVTGAKTADELYDLVSCLSLNMNSCDGKI